MLTLATTDRWRTPNAWIWVMCTLRLVTVCGAGELWPDRQRFVERYTVDCFAANLGAAFHHVLGAVPATAGQVPQP